MTTFNVRYDDKGDVVEVQLSMADKRTLQRAHRLHAILETHCGEDGADVELQKIYSADLTPKGRAKG